MVSKVNYGKFSALLTEAKQIAGKKTGGVGVAWRLVRTMVPHASYAG